MALWRRNRAVLLKYMALLDQIKKINEIRRSCACRRSPPNRKIENSYRFVYIENLLISRSVVSHSILTIEFDTTILNIKRFSNFQTLSVQIFGFLKIRETQRQKRFQKSGVRILKALLQRYRAVWR